MAFLRLALERVMAEGFFEVTVRGIAAGGAGVADLPDGRVVFVPRTAPGDVARVRIDKSRPRWASASLEKLIAPGDQRAEPACSLYRTCGGCQLQHLPYERQLDWKARIVADALTRIGGVDALELPEVVPSPDPLRYRSRVSYTLRRLRDGAVVAGFHALGRPAHVIDVAGECLLPSERLRDAWVELRRGWGQGASRLPRGGRLRLTLREEVGSVELLVEGGAAGWSSAPLAEAVPALARVWHRPAGTEGEPARAGGTSDQEDDGPAFSQVNERAAALLVEHVVGVAGPGGGEGARRAVDAYCGTGVFGHRLASTGWTVTGIEADPAGSRAAEREAPDGFEVLRGTVEDRLPAALPADLVVLNPPRTGVAPQVLRELLDRPSGRVVYVSCDPATLARDVRGLASGYRLTGLRCFDLFPQTAHVESVAVLEPVSARGDA